jgi:transposase, IS5 family
MMASNPWREGFEAIMFRTVNDQPTLWDSILPPELLVLPVELGRVDGLLDDPVFFAPFAAYFDARLGRPSIPMETYLRLMFLKFRYRLGYESLCREVSDSISWQRFWRIPFGTRVPHPTTLMKITTCCGQDAVTGLNEALLVKAATAKLLRTDKVRADTTVIEAAVAYPTDSGLLAKAIGSMARSVARIKAAGGATRTRSRDRRRSAGRRARSIAAKLKLRGEQQRGAAQAAVRRITGELAAITEAAMREAATVIGNARRALRGASGHRKGRLQRAINRLDTLVGCAERVVAQARSRLGGVMPESASRVVSLHDVDARPIRKGRLGKPVEFGYKLRSSTTPTGSSSITPSRSETPQTRRSWPRRSLGSPPAPDAFHARSPPTAATAKHRWNRTCTVWGFAAWRSPARVSPVPHAASSNTGAPSARR